MSRARKCVTTSLPAILPYGVDGAMGSRSALHESEIARQETVDAGGHGLLMRNARPRVPKNITPGPVREKETAMAKGQKKLEGFTEVDDDRVEELAQKYKEETDAWLAAQKVALETEKELQAAFEKNKKLVDAARKHPKGKVRVGGVLLKVRVKDPTLKISVKILGDDVEEGSSEEEAAE